MFKVSIKSSEFSTCTSIIELAIWSAPFRDETCGFGY